MIDRFHQCLPYVLEHEGGNDDDPDDPGGRTSRGITQREYDAWCHVHGYPGGDVWKAPETSIEAIYETQYWLPHSPLLPAGLDYTYFDCAVLHGPYRAAIWLQKAAGVVADGHIGVITRAAVAKAEPQELINAMSQSRKTFMRGLRLYWKYGTGWIRRANEVRSVALKMAEENSDAVRLEVPTS
jgi:lysozyme family protein